MAAVADEQGSAALPSMTATTARSTTAPLIRFLIVAEFDIDKGSVVRHQYPSATGVSESCLAESMLPEGGHLHENDWTFFFIRPPVDKDDIKVASLGDTVAASMDSDLGGVTTLQALQQQCETEVTGMSRMIKCFIMDPEDGQYVPLRFDVDLLRARFRVATSATPSSSPAYTFDVELPDTGAIVRSVKIGDHLTYSLRDEDLLIVLSPDADTDLLLQFESHEDLMRFEGVLIMVIDSVAGNLCSAENDMGPDPDIDQQFANLREREAAMLVCINLVRTKLDQTVRRGAIVKAIAIVTSYRYVEMFKPMMTRTLDEIFRLSDDVTAVVGVLADLYNKVNAAQCPEVEVTALHTRVLRALCGTDLQTYPCRPCDVEIAGEIETLRVPIVDSSDEELGGVRVVDLVRTFGEGVMTLYNAALLGRRILFLGHNLAAAHVARMVLATVALVRPLSGLLQRSYPYAHLTNLDFLEVPGYIAGVTNPIFANHFEWFDVLADIKLGTVTVTVKGSSGGQGGPLSAISGGGGGGSQQDKAVDGGDTGLDPLDAEMYGILTAGGTATYGEDWTRGVFYDYTQSFLDQVYSRELFPDDTRRRCMFEGNAVRLSEYRSGCSFRTFDIRQKHAQRRSIFGKHFNTIRTSTRLLQVRRLPTRQITAVLDEICARLLTDEHIWQLLDLLPPCRSGLGPIAMALFGPAPVRAAALSLLERIESAAVGAKAIDQLPVMVLLAYRRMRRQQSEQEQPNLTVKMASFRTLPNAESLTSNEDMSLDSMGRLAIIKNGIRGTWGSHTDRRRPMIKMNVRSDNHAASSSDGGPDDLIVPPTPMSMMSISDVVDNESSEDDEYTRTPPQTPRRSPRKSRMTS